MTLILLPAWMPDSTHYARAYTQIVKLTRDYHEAQAGAKSGKAAQCATAIRGLVVRDLGLPASAYRAAVYTREALGVMGPGIAVTVGGGGSEPPVTHVLLPSAPRVISPFIEAGQVEGAVLWIHGANGDVVAEYYRLSQLYTLTQVVPVEAPHEYVGGPYGIWQMNGAPAGARLLDADAPALIRSAHPALLASRSADIFLRVESWASRLEPAGLQWSDAFTSVPNILTQIRATMRVPAPTARDIMEPALQIGAACDRLLREHTFAIVQHRRPGGGQRPVLHRACTLTAVLARTLADLQTLCTRGEAQPSCYLHVLETLLTDHAWEYFTERSLQGEPAVVTALARCAQVMLAAQTALRNLRQ